MIIILHSHLYFSESYKQIISFIITESFESGKRKLKLAETYSDLNTDVSDEEKSKKERKIRAAKKCDSDTDSDSQIVECVLKPFPKIKTHKSIKNTKTITDNKCENVQHVDDQHLASSSSSQSNNHILFSDLAPVTKSQKRDTIMEVEIKNKRIRKDNIDKDFEEDGKENLHPSISAGMCISIFCIYFIIIHSI